MAPLIAGPHNKPSVAVLCIAAFAAVRREVCTRGNGRVQGRPIRHCSKGDQKTNVLNVGKVSIPRIKGSQPRQ